MQEHWNNIYPTLFQPRLNVQISPTTPTHGNNSITQKMSNLREKFKTCKLVFLSDEIGTFASHDFFFLNIYYNYNILIMVFGYLRHCPFLWKCRVFYHHADRFLILWSMPLRSPWQFCLKKGLKVSNIIFVKSAFQPSTGSTQKQFHCSKVYT